MYLCRWRCWSWESGTQSSPSVTCSIMARSRTTKSLAKRIDLAYFRHPGALRRLRTILIVLMGLASLAWIIPNMIRRNDSVHNPGPLASVHTNIQNCAQCHVNSNSRFFKTVTDQACLQCHDGAIHHPNQTSLISTDRAQSSDCAKCHIEHRGAS